MSLFNGLVPGLRPWAEALVRAGGAGVHVTSVYRSRAQQARLYRRYLSGNASFPAAPPGYSYHEYGRAFDIVAPARTLDELGALWTRWGGVWGGRSDPIHFQA